MIRGLTLVLLPVALAACHHGPNTTSTGDAQPANNQAPPDTGGLSGNTSASGGAVATTAGQPGGGPASTGGTLSGTGPVGSQGNVGGH